MTDDQKAAQSTWMLVDLFKIEQAACLWVEVDPSLRWSNRSATEKSEVSAANQMLSSAIDLKQLPISRAASGQRLGGKTPLVSRQDLKVWAKTKNETPKFLFDTLMPFSDPERATEASVAKNKGGRPPTYDWDAFIIEIIRIAEDEQLPDTRPELTQKMLSWFSETYDQQPTERLVSERVYNIYKVLRPKQ